jgi:ribitol-5-phosphate 2-dehydrogenase (NADP+) / D-ribitol-5-phosphate cytidylyltransferase
MNLPCVKAILLMGGEGLRFESDIPKQFLNLSGKKIYLYTLNTFLSFSEFSQILLVCHKSWIKYVAAEVSDPRVRIIEGGHTRQDSSYRGLIACGKETTHVVIHDAVRPFVSKKIIQDNLNALQKHKAVDTCIPSADTIVHAETFDHISSIPNRSKYLRGQTPQSFSYSLLLKAHEKALSKNSSDDCKLILDLGQNVHIVPGSENNIKITNELDLFLAEQLMRLKKIALNAPTDSLKGKTYAITGGTGGIGSALAKLLKKEGAHPLVISKSSPTFAVDLTNYKETQSLFDVINKKYGLLDGLINCIGFLSLKPFQALTPEEIDHILATNLHALIYCCRCAVIKEGGHIINLSSSSFTRGRKSYTLYSSAKAAIVNFTQGLAEEHPELYINAVIPQRTATPMRKNNFPSEKLSSLLSPTKVAQEILNLLKQSGTTGSLLEVRKK